MTRERVGSRDTWRALALSLLFVSSLLSVFLIVERRTDPDVEPQNDAEPPEPVLVLLESSFDELPGWKVDDLDGVALALRRSCEVLARRPDDRPLSSTGLGGSTGDWRPLCDGVSSSTSGKDLKRLLLLETRPWVMQDGEKTEGLLTGYYEPSLRGSRTPSEVFRTPLYRKPPELVSVELGSFRDDLRGLRVAGQVSAGRLEPYPDRKELETGSLAGRGLELVWVDNAVDAFFLHIQGSGRVELEGGGELRLGYAGQNGHSYRAIGRELVDRGEMVLEEVSMQSIRAWLEANPEKASGVMESNPSYVFFRELSGDGPLGSQGVALTPGRSLAVDRSFVPLGVPVWVDSTVPSLSAQEEEPSLQRLFVAQDTGGAIRGPLRGDVFWGHGAEAAEVAGRMRQRARMWLLLPRHLSPPPAYTSAER